MTVNNNFYILTGGPGSGKTTLVEQLTTMGYKCVSEVGRKIIKQQLSCNGTALPWVDADDYANLMLQHSLQDYTTHYSQTDICFFDRGIPDVLGYTELINSANREIYINSVENYRYNPTVFILPPWEAIYEKDTERKQDFELAIATYEVMKKVYTRYGYNLIEVPPVSILQRAYFILDRVDK